MGILATKTIRSKYMKTDDNTITMVATLMFFFALLIRFFSLFSKLIQFPDATKIV